MTNPTTKRRKPGRPKASERQNPIPKQLPHIRGDESLRADAFMQRMKISDGLFGQWQEQGLETTKVGRYRYVTGEQFQAFLRKLSEQEKHRIDPSTNPNQP